MAKPRIKSGPRNWKFEMTKKTLTVRPLGEREAPELQKRGRGWAISDKRLDAIHEQARRNKMEPTAAQKLLHEKLIAANEPGIEGVVVGRALYDGRIDVPAALRLAAG